MRANIEMTKRMGKAKWYFQMKIIIKEILKMDYSKDMGSISINIKTSYIKGIGKQAFNKDRGIFNLRMGQ